MRKKLSKGEVLCQDLITRLERTTVVVRDYRARLGQNSTIRQDIMMLLEVVDTLLLFKQELAGYIHEFHACIKENEKISPVPRKQVRKFKREKDELGLE